MFYKLEIEFKWKDIFHMKLGLFIEMVQTKCYMVMNGGGWTIAEMSTY